jgi:murein DD-endopeptidase MepM/ murein hydrolase activator NlpD
MRRSTPDRRGWLASHRSRFGNRVVLLLFVLSTVGGLFVSTTPPIASADELSDAYARQQEIQRLIAKQKASIRALTANQAVLTTRISSTKSSLREVNANLAAVKTQIVSMIVDVARSQNAVDELNATVGRLDTELLEIEAEAAAKQAEMDARIELLASRIREAYDADRTSFIETMLSSADFTDALTEVGYQLDFAEQDKILADQIVQDQKVLDVLQANVLSARAQTAELEKLAAQAKKVLDRQLGELRSAQKALLRLERQTQKLLEEQKAAYEQMARDKAELEQRLNDAREAEKKLEQLINKLVQKMFEDGGIPSEYNGTLDWPMQGTVTQEFGCTGFGMEPPLGNCAHFRRGIDIANTAGTKIRASAPGKVILAGRSPYDPAYIVVIAHSSHLVTWYGHLQTNIPVKVGQYVGKGHVVGYEGCTGWCTGPHLHWAVQLNETWVNPRLFLPR